MTTDKCIRNILFQMRRVLGTFWTSNNYHTLVGCAYFLCVHFNFVLLIMLLQMTKINHAASKTFFGLLFAYVQNYFLRRNSRKNIFLCIKRMILQRNDGVWAKITTSTRMMEANMACTSVAMTMFGCLWPSIWKKNTTR